MKTEELKAALLNRQFEHAESLIRAWGQDVARQAADTADPQERQRLLQQALTLGEESICLARVVRAQIATELQSNSASFLYSDADLEQPRWRVNG